MDSPTPGAEAPAPGRRARRLGLLRRLPSGLIGAVLAIAGIEAAIDDAAIHVLNTFQLDWEERGDDAGGRRAAAEILCLGDSQLKLGLLPQVIEARTGRSAYNLALIGGQAPSTFALLRRVLDDGRRPDAVLVGFFPAFLRREPWDVITLLPHALDARDAVDLGLSARDPELLGHLLLAEALPSFRDRANLRGMIATSLAGRPPSQAGAHIGALRNWRVNRGAQVMPANPARDDDPEAWRDEHFPDVAFNPLYVGYVDRCFGLAEAHGIPIYWVLPPMTPAVQQACERSGFDADYAAFVRRMADRHPGLVVLDARHLIADPALFADPHHLGREGALVLSHAVCDALGSGPTAPGGTRWVALSRGRSRPIGPAIEHLAESEAIARDRLRAVQRR